MQFPEPQEAGSYTLPAELLSSLQRAPPDAHVEADFFYLTPACLNL